jgi:hypothetical protein
MRSSMKVTINFFLLHSTPSIYEARRPFKVPKVRFLLIVAILLGLVGDVGLVGVYELSEESDVDLLRLSSARMSSRDTLR